MPTRLRFAALAAIAAALFALAGCVTQGGASRGRIVVAYVSSWSRAMPDPALVTHVNYAFGHVGKTFDGVRIDNPARLRSIAALKRAAPHLKVLLSIGGWGSGGFSEMASSAARRAAFARSCRAAAASYGLDGIDIDWEYPGVSAAGISASPADTANYTLLMRDLRAALGPRALLTLASVSSARHVNFRDVMPYVDFVNIMAYDMARPPLHHAALRVSRNARDSVESALKAHLDAGIPPWKLALGLPFYGRGSGPLSGNIDYSRICALRGYRRYWDGVAGVPFLVDAQGRFVCCYDDAESLRLKCAFAMKQGLRGVMYWESASDDSRRTLARAVHSAILQPSR